MRRVFRVPAVLDRSFFADSSHPGLVRQLVRPSVHPAVGFDHFSRARGTQAVKRRTTYNCRMVPWTCV